MKTFRNQAAQGDLLLRRIETVPDGFACVEPRDGAHIVAHSETGHHHVVLADPGVTVLRDPREPGRAVVRVETEARLEHRRAWDTHETIVIPPGIFELRRQREATPEGWRRVTD